MGFPLWALLRFWAPELGRGSAQHCTSDWTSYEGDLKGRSTSSQECCPSSASCSLVEKRGTLEVRGYWVTVERCWSENLTLRHLNVPLTQFVGEKFKQFSPFYSAISAFVIIDSKGIVCIVAAFKDLGQPCLVKGPVTFKLSPCSSWARRRQIQRRRRAQRRMCVWFLSRNPLCTSLHCFPFWALLYEKNKMTQ